MQRFIHPGDVAEKAQTKRVLILVKIIREIENIT
jgi:hypothetical protein